MQLETFERTNPVEYIMLGTYFTFVLMASLNVLF